MLYASTRRVAIELGVAEGLKVGKKVHSHQTAELSCSQRKHLSNVFNK